MGIRGLGTRDTQQENSVEKARYIQISGLRGGAEPFRPKLGAVGDIRGPGIIESHGILGGTGPGTGCYFAYSTLFTAILGGECLVDFLFKVFLIFSIGSLPVTQGGAERRGLHANNRISDMAGRSYF